MAQTVLSKIGEASVKPLLSLLGHRNSKKRLAVVRVLGKLRGKRVTTALLKALGDKIK